MSEHLDDDSFEPVPDGGMDVREYLRVLAHDKWRILGTALALLLIFWLVDVLFVDETYRSTVPLAVEPARLEALFDYPNGGQPRSVADLELEAKTIDLPQVQQALDQQLDFGYDVAAQPSPGSTGSLDISATAATRARSLQALTAAVQTFIDKRIALGLAAVEERKQPVVASIADIQAQRDRVSAPLDSLNSQLADNPTPEREAILLAEKTRVVDEIGDDLAALDQAIADAQGPLEIYDQIEQRIQEGSTQRTTGAPQTVSASPGGGHLPLLGLLLGLILGILISIGRRALDKSVRKKSELEAATGKTVLGLVPRITEWDESDEPQNVALHHPASPPAESYRSLCASLPLLTVDPTVRSVLITSAIDGEGKTTTVANIAVTLARSGRRVMVIDGDLRKPRLHSFFGSPSDPGLTSALTETPIADVVLDVLGNGTLLLVAAGAVDDCSFELLDSDRLAPVLDELFELADIILIDSPPVVPVGDALKLSRNVDCVLVVAAAGKTKPQEARRAVELLDQVGAPIAGCILNSVSREMGDAYAFEYRYTLDAPPATSPIDESDREALAAGAGSSEDEPSTLT